MRVVMVVEVEVEVEVEGVSCRAVGGEAREVRLTMSSRVLQVHRSRCYLQLPASEQRADGGTGGQHQRNTQPARPQLGSTRWLSHGLADWWTDSGLSAPALSKLR